MPTAASSLIPPALDRLRQQPAVASEEVSGLLERLVERGTPALTACAVLAGATWPPAVGEWTADAPAHVLDRPGNARRAMAA